MARQKFLPVHAGKPWSLGPTDISARPRLAQLVAECIAIWPFIENDLALFLGGLLKANTRPALSVFFAIRAGRMQREVMIAAATATLPDDDLQIVKAALAVIASAETARNDLAHGVWGASGQLPDALIWVEGKDLGPWNAEAVLREMDPDKPTHRELEERMFVYRERDLVSVKEQLQAARQISFDLAQFGLWKPGRPGTLEQMRENLVSARQVRRVLDDRRPAEVSAEDTPEARG